MAKSPDRMLHSDAFAWYMEKDPVLRSTIVAVNRLETSPDWPLLRLRIDRLTRLVPRLRMRVQAPPLRLGPPRWSVDEDFDLDFHLRRVRLGSGDWSEVLDFARNAAMADFDRARPLWEFTVLDGLADGGAAFVTKLHHSLTDGIGGIQLAALVVDVGPEPDRSVELPPPPAGHGLSSARLAVLALADDTADVAAAAGEAVGAIEHDAITAARHPASTLRAMLGTAQSVARFVAPVNRPHSRLLGQRSISRSVATLDVPFATLHDAAAASGGHLNDAFLAAMTDAMQRYHDKRGARLDRVRVTVPLSIRTEQDGVGGNRITLARMTLPAGIASPAVRIKRIQEVVGAWRREPALAHTQRIAAGLNFMPRSYLQNMLKRVEMLASDVPGVPQPVWLAGARIIGYYAFGPTIGAAVNATLMSYAGMCNIGINIDTQAIDDPALWMDCLDAAFEDVLAAAPATS
ncbi:MAG TPA: wax ester/triacylglycerol synthase domain-containing protein [Jatrophihabitans sp.]|nr:wax ester/triacylglycerol synthase domain-containing protein [Jatrophihabitans sp.]